MSTPVVVVHQDEASLAQAAAARLVVRIVDAQSARGRAHVVLTGGGIGIGALAALAASPARDAVDWRHVDVWWGDERFLPSGDPERNETQAREALLDRVPVPAGNIHAMPASDGPDRDVDSAARRYARTLRAAVRPGEHSAVPLFDVLLLGVGPDGHVASLFPEHPALHSTEGTTVGVHGAPKPPPLRISLTMPAINAAEDVWLLASGAGKAGAVHLALTSAGTLAVPAAGPRGRRQTLWLLDHAAAAQVPRELVRPASP